MGVGGSPDKRGTTEQEFELAIANKGEPIEAAIVFLPFSAQGTV
jgi:hypothetical protein